MEDEPLIYIPLRPMAWPPDGFGVVRIRFRDDANVKEAVVVRAADQREVDAQLIAEALTNGRLRE